MTEHEFCRTLLALTMETVRKHTTTSQRQQAWTYRSTWGAGNHRLEFHGPDGYHWWGRECCLWAARSNGWDSWLESIGSDTEV